MSKRFLSLLSKINSDLEQARGPNLQGCRRRRRSRKRSRSRSRRRRKTRGGRGAGGGGGGRGGGGGGCNNSINKHLPPSRSGTGERA
jgi:hypothetical protein